MSVLVLGLGLVLIIEGLVFALAPSRVEEMLETIRLLPVDARRLIGLLALVVGVALLALARAISG